MKDVEAGGGGRTEEPMRSALAHDGFTVHEDPQRRPAYALGRRVPARLASHEGVEVVASLVLPACIYDH